MTGMTSTIPVLLHQRRQEEEEEGISKRNEELLPKNIIDLEEKRRSSSSSSSSSVSTTFSSLSSSSSSASLSSLSSSMHNNSTTKKEQSSRLLATRMVKAASKRLLSVNIDDEFIADAIANSNDSSSSKDKFVTGLDHSQIVLGKELGHGSFSSVYEIKSLRMDNDEKNDFDDDECDIIADQDHDEQEEEEEEEVLSMSSTTATTTNTKTTALNDELVVKVLKPEVVRKPSDLAACTADLIKEGAILASLQDHTNILQIVGWTRTPTLLMTSSSSSIIPDFFSSSRSSGGNSSFRHDSFFLVLGKLHTTLEDQLIEWRRSNNGGNSSNSDNNIFLNGTRPQRKKMMMKKKKKQHRQQLQKQLQEEEKQQEQNSSSSSLFLQHRLKILTDLADVIRYVHSKGIIHRDIKPENIGFDSNGTLKLFDFDVARRIISRTATATATANNYDDDDDMNTLYNLTQHVGTPRYMSNECALGLPYNFKTDVYAYGLICYELLTLKRPYSNIRPENHFKSVFVKNKRPSLPPKSSSSSSSLFFRRRRRRSCWPNSLRVFVGNCWSNKIEERPTMNDAFRYIKELSHQSSSESMN